MVQTPFDPIAEDAPESAEWPQAFSSLVIGSGGAPLVGHVYIPSGAGAHPIVILSHGFPGYEWNSDVAWTLCRSSCFVVAYHYRGCWGSNGPFRFTAALEDLRTVVRYVRSEAFTSRYFADPQTVILVGHSMGGFLSLMAAAGDPELNHVVSLAGYHLSTLANPDENPTVLRRATELIDNALPALPGATRDALLNEIRDAAPGWNLLSPSLSFRSKHLLLLAGTLDPISQPAVHHAPLCERLASEGCDLETHTLKADHLFSQQRVRMIRIVRDWMRRQDTRVS